MSARSNVDYIVLERGWLSSNNIVFAHGEQTVVVDTGYCSHADQTLVLLGAALKGRSLNTIVNTHLHSDHCGGNASLLAQYPAARVWIPPGQAKHVSDWDATALSYVPTGQECPLFSHHHLLQPGQTIQLGQHFWEIHSAPGHDPHSVILFEPDSRTLISADALWQNGFGVVFQELDGAQAFDEVSATLDLIEGLAPLTVIPGHGAVFADAHAALARARSRLEMFVRDPIRHANYGGKVLIKYKLLDWQRCTRAQLQQWTDQTPYFNTLHQRFFAEQAKEQWLESLLIDLQRTGALDLHEEFVVNRD
jgi:glyoxylase-like metal-dependent hydrolase (beta-lactamase superfamily II)